MKNLSVLQISVTLSNWYGRYGSSFIVSKVEQHKPGGQCSAAFSKLMNKGRIILAVLYFFFFSSLIARGQIVTTVAGNGVAGSSGDGGPAMAASINASNWIASDKFGNVYFTNLYTIRKIDTSGIITTIAGNGIAGYSGDGGPATAAMLNGIQSVAVSNAGNLYIADVANNRIRMVNTAGIISTVGGTGVAGICTGTGPATSTTIQPFLMTTDSTGNIFFSNNYSICKINTSGVVSIIAGNPLVPGFSGDGGAATACLMLGASTFATDNFGNLYFTDDPGAGNRIRKISPAGIITTVAGNGTSGYSGDGGQATNAHLYGAWGLTVDSVGKLYIADANNYRVRVVNTAGVITTIAGTGIAGYSGDGGPATAAKFTYPGGVALGKAGDIYIPDDYRIRKVSYQNRPPRYSGGPSQSLAVCANSLYDSIGTQLSVVDSDLSQLETWSTVLAPVHGALAAAATGFSNGGLLHPAGLYYTPAAGYSGNDSFRVRVTDGIAADTTTIHITVTPGPAAITGSGSMCAGATTTLADSTIGGYWSSAAPLVANVGTSGVVSGVSPGTVAILYSSGGCSAQKVITVNAIPIGYTVTGGGAYCAGGAGLHVALSASQGGVSYQLFRGGTGLATLTGTGPALDFGVQAIAGVYTVVGTATGFSCSHNMAGSATITVNPLPAVITGPAALCTGTLVTETDSATGGVWSSAGGSVSVVGSTGVVTGISLGTAVITYTLPTTCMASKTLTVSLGPGAIIGSPTVCAGATVTLTDAVSGGVWASSLPANATIGSLSGLVTGGMPGTTTTITYSLGAGCTVSSIISVNASPAAITGAGNVCAGAVITLTDATAGGVWSAGSGASVTGAGTTAIVTGVSAGSTTIAYTVAGCAATKTVTVHVTPELITGPAAVCPVATVTEADVTTGGIWSTTSANFSIGSGSGMVTGITAGTGSITYALGACATTRNITVNAAPAITGPTGICNGGTAILATTIPGGAWGSSATGIATIGSTGLTTALVSGIANGTATISYLLPTGCTASVSVTVNSAPSAIAGSLHVCAGATTILSDTAGGGVWSVGSSIVSVGTTGSATSSLITGVAVGTVTITYSLGSLCTVTAIVTVTASPAAITGAGSVCAGSTTIITDLTAGGVWSAGSGEVSVAGSGATATVTGISVGTVTIDYTAAGCAASRLFTVNLTPAAITGVTYLCAGLTSTLSETITGGTWSSSLPAIATVTTTGSPLTTTLGGVTNGITIISYSLPDGCVATRPITINAAAAPITGSSSVCIGSSAAQADITPGGTWSSSLPAIGSVSATGIITGVGVGATTISYTAGGCQNTKTISVTAMPGPITGPVSVCLGTAITATDAGGGQWAGSNPFIASIGSATGIITGLATGAVTISYTLDSGCTVTETVTVRALPSPIAGPAIVCAGGSVSLSDPAPGGVWSSSDVTVGTITASGVVTGLSAGATTISYFVPSIGCAATHTINSLVVPAITGIHSICAWGDTMNISNTITTGIYTSSLVTVTNLGGGYGRVTANAPGTATVMYLLPSGCSTSTMFMVNVLPAAIGGVVAMCVGASLSLTDATPGGVWSAGAGVVSVGSSSGLVTSLAAGSGTVTYTAPVTGCVADTVITVTGMPVAGLITGIGSMCVGNSVTLTDTATGGAWSHIGGATTIAAAGTSVVVSGGVAGVDTIVYAVSNMCGTAAARMAVTVEPMPLAGVITGVDSVCVGNHVVLAASVTGGVWSVSNASAGIDTTGKVTGLAAGMDTVIYSVSNAWCGVQTTYPVQVIALGLCPSLMVMAVGADAFKVWPNPAEGNITVSCGEGGELSVVDITGRCVGAYKMRQGDNNITLAEGVSGGVYLVVFNGDNGVRETVRLVVE